MSEWMPPPAEEPEPLEDQDEDLVLPEVEEDDLLLPDDDELQN
jgi:hypothetical protein